MSAEQVTPPLVLWAQRNSLVFLTICLEDCKEPEIRIDANSVFFKGVGGTEMKPHEITIELYKEVDPDKSKKFLRDRNIELVLKKKEDGPFWPHLTKDKQKYHWLKVDFSKWRDEDDSDDEREDDFEEMVRQMGGLGSFGGEGGDMAKPSFGDLEQGSDSDDESMPDLE